MSCEEALNVLDAYMDAELEPVKAAQVGAHFGECERCRARLQERRALSQAVRAHSTYYTAPQGLEDRIRAGIGGAPKTTIPPSTRRPLHFGWQFSSIAASIIALVVAGAVCFQVLQRPSTADSLAEQVVSSHVRSLMVNHLMDVPSTDQHTVKPWFNGKLDFAPTVKDFAAQGFPLIGGRLDYLDGRPVAALLYKRHQHVINLFVWPSSKSGLTPHTINIRGYNIVHWTRSGMNFWAISDLNGRELMDFARDEQNAG